MSPQDGVHIVADADSDAADAADAADASDVNTVGGERLDRFLGRKLAAAGLSRTRIQSLIRAGAVSERDSGDIVTDAGRKIKTGTAFRVCVPAPMPSHIAAQEIPLSILHEDESLLVLDKPAGLAVHPAPGQRRDTLVNALLAHCGATLSGIGGVVRPGIVHRLDKDTSGLLVVAKTDGAHQALARQFAAHGRDDALQREYVALVWGRPVPDAGRLDAPIGRASGRARLRMRASPRRGGREAVTRYRITRKYAAGAADGTGDDGIVSRLLCRLETGRTHQIRVHLSHIGHPLLGDALYGAGFRSSVLRLPSPVRETVAALQRQALHAWRLGFRHPQSGEPMHFESPLPPDLRRVEAALASLDSLPASE